MNDGRGTPATTGSSFTVVSLPNVLVLLNPERLVDREYLDTNTLYEDNHIIKTISRLDVENADSVKMWVLNRLNLWLSNTPNSRTWNHYWGSFEGCLSYPRLREYRRRGQEHPTLRRVHIKLSRGRKYYIYWAPERYTDEEIPEICLNFAIESSIVQHDSGTVKRPYPDSDWDATLKAFTQPDFCSMQIPANMISYSLMPANLNHWQYYIFRNSLDDRIVRWRSENAPGRLSTPGEAIRSYLTSKRGSFRINYVNDSRSTAIYGTDEIDLRLAQLDLFFTRKLSDYIHQAGLESEPDQAGPVDEQASVVQDVRDEIELHRLWRPNDERRMTKPSGGMVLEARFLETLNNYLIIKFSRLPTERPSLPRDFLNWVRSRLGYDPRIEHNNILSRTYCIDRIEINHPNVRASAADVYLACLEAVSALLRRKGTTAFNKNIMRFGIGIGWSEDTALTDAINRVAANFEGRITVEEYDHMLERIGRGEVIENRLRCAISLKRVFFATGSDAFSDDLVPKHVYKQILDWWKDLEPYQKSELCASCEIEVLGYSSRMTSERQEGLGQADNIRLRADRAWKTAVALQIVLANEPMIKKPLELQEQEEVSGGTNSSEPWTAPRLLSLVQSREIPLVQSTTVVQGYQEWHETDEMIRQLEEKIPLLYRGMPIDSYPSDWFHQHETSFTLDVLGNRSTGAPATRERDSNIRDDRVAVIVFKRIVENNFFVRRVSQTNTSLPIYLYQPISTHQVGNDFCALCYVCPGEFDDEGTQLPDGS